MISLGIDIGTTNISVLALDLETGTVTETYSAPNKRLETADSYAYLQDPEKIEKTVRELLTKLKTPFDAAAVTGQVHGILYYDRHGKAVSPLYTWLDRRAAESVDGETPAERLKRRTGRTVPPGYGLVTHYAQGLRGEVPEEAVGMTGILEYITGRLIGGNPLKKADASCMSPFGAYDAVTEQSDPRVLEEVFRLAHADFPKTSAPFEQAGEIKRGAVMAYPVGDNQAGFFGTVPDPRRDCLVSVGTSGQISLFSTSDQCPESMELRPYLGLGFLHVGAVLCAGKAYETVKNFFKQSAVELGMTDIDDEKVFRMMKRSAEQTRTVSGSQNLESLHVITAFNGTRKDPGRRGSVKNITLDNLTPGNLVWGTIEGIIAELHDFSLELGELFSPVKRIVTAGSAFRKNHLFGKVLEDQFGLETASPKIEDGAAFGAALIAAVSADLITLDRVREIVQQNIQFS